VHVLTNQSMLYAEMARTGPSREPARQALRLAFQAQEEGRYIPVPRLHALIALRHASAASLLADKAAFQAGIIQARRELDRGPRDDSPPEWLRFVDETEITGVEARGWLNLGDASRGAQLYRQVLASGLSTRNRASYGAGLADALLKQGARQEAVTVATEVLPALEGGVTSMRCLNRLRLVRQAAGNTAGAQEFCERFDAVERVLAASYRLPEDDAQGTRADVPALCGTGHPQPQRTKPTLIPRKRARPRAGGHEPRLMSSMNPAHTCGLTARRAPSGFFESRTRQHVPAWATSTQSLPPVLRLDLRHGRVNVVSCSVVIGTPSLACGSLRRTRPAPGPGSPHRSMPG